MLAKEITLNPSGIIFVNGGTLSALHLNLSLSVKLLQSSSSVTSPSLTQFPALPGLPHLHLPQLQLSADSEMIPLILVFLLIPVPTIGMLSAIYAEVNCSPTDWYPFYNCDEPLFIIVWDMRYPPHYNTTSDTFYIHENSTALGLATYDIEREPSDWFNYSSYNMITVGNTYAKIDYGRYDNGTGMSVFQHEVQHIICKCTWHPRT